MNFPGLTETYFEAKDNLSKVLDEYGDETKTHLGRFPNRITTLTVGFESA